MDSIFYLMARETFLGPSIFYPSPGSRIFDDLASQPSFNPDYMLLRSSAFPVETQQVSRLDIVTLLRLARWINFIKGLLASMGIREISLENLREKAFTEWWPEAVPKTETVSAGDLYYFSLLHPLQRDHAGRILTAFFLNRKNFYGVLRLKDPQKKFYNYQIFPYKTSSTVVDLFRRSGKNNDIRSAIMKKK